MDVGDEVASPLFHLQERELQGLIFIFAGFSSVLVQTQRIEFKSRCLFRLWSKIERQLAGDFTSGTSMLYTAPLF